MDDERWAHAHRISDGHPSALLKAAIDLLVEAECGAGGRNVIEWTREAIMLRGKLPPTPLGQESVVYAMDPSKMRLTERARLAPAATQLAIAQAWLDARGDRYRAIEILGTNEGQWARAITMLKLSDALRQICPAVRS